MQSFNTHPTKTILGMNNNIDLKNLQTASAPILVVENIASYFKLDIKKGNKNTRIAHYSIKPKSMAGKAGFLK